MSRMIFNVDLARRFIFLFLISASHININIRCSLLSISRDFLFVILLVSRLLIVLRIFLLEQMHIKGLGRDRGII